MNALPRLFLFLFLACGVLSTYEARSEVDEERTEIVSTEQHAEEAEHHGPNPWSVIPFVALLLMIATGPLFYEHFWHKIIPLFLLSWLFWWWPIILSACKTNIHRFILFSNIFSSYRCLPGFLSHQGVL